MKLKAQTAMERANIRHHVTSSASSHKYTPGGLRLLENFENPNNSIHTDASNSVRDSDRIVQVICNEIYINLFGYTILPK